MFADLLARLGRALDASGLPYMVIGGQAVLLHGEPRLTRDVDITLGAGLERVGDVVALLGVAGLRALVDPAVFTAQTLVLPCQDESSGLRVDFIFSFTPYEQEAIARAVPVTLGGSTVRFATAEDLVVHKVLAGRPRDLEDVKGVLWKNPSLDVRTVRDTLAALGEAIDQPLAARFDEILALGSGSRR